MITSRSFSSQQEGAFVTLFVATNVALDETYL